MKKIKILDLENDGLNMAADGQFLYIRSRRTMYKYSLSDMSLMAQNVIFEKDGKARGFSVCDKFVFLTDFCDLYILYKYDLQIAEVIRLGVDLSSDLGAVRFDENKAYICIRNGKMAAMDIAAKAVKKFEISDSSSWDHYVVENRIYTGTVKGELIETSTADMRLVRKIELCKKNIYSVVYCDGMIYTASQDMTIKVVDSKSFETVGVAQKAVKGMAKILGLYKNLLVVADSNQISIWDKQTLQLNDRFEFPTGQFNKGALLHEGRLLGSDFQSIYSMVLE